MCVCCQLGNESVTRKWNKFTEKKEWAVQIFKSFSLNWNLFSQIFSIVKRKQLFYCLICSQCRPYHNQCLLHSQKRKFEVKLVIKWLTQMRFYKAQSRTQRLFTIYLSLIYIKRWYLYFWHIKYFRLLVWGKNFRGKSLGQEFWCENVCRRMMVMIAK